jgi:hypothetical protein
MVAAEERRAFLMLFPASLSAVMAAAVISHPLLLPAREVDPAHPP